MERRTMLKRVGTAGLGIGALTAGSASAANDQVSRVEIDGETYVLTDGVSADEVDTDYCCECQDPPTYCPCTCCGPC